MTATAALVPGLCSITLRALPVDEVLAVALRSGVEAIEWGADVHVPPGDVARATDVGRRGRDAGVEVASYGSYLGAGPLLGGDDDVEPVLDAAEALGTSTVRVWTELGVTPDSPGSERTRVEDTTAALADAAGARGLDLALEFHPGTLTHTAASTLALLALLDRPNLRTHWQPDPALDGSAALDELRAVRPQLASLHVFTWGRSGIEDRRALDEGADLWPAALAVARPVDDAAPRYALCEYVRDDSADQVVRDVITLRAWIADLDG